MATKQSADANALDTKSEEAASAASQGHPSGLYVLFGAEAWERFSYYGMRALLVLYLTKHLNVPRAHALEIYGLYTGLVYLTPLLGGFLADKMLGRRKAVLIGGIIMALGQIFLMFPSTLTLALGLLVAGNGFFKPNISTMVGQLYRRAMPDATAHSRSSTWASTSARSTRRSSAARSGRARCSAGRGVSALPRWG